MSGRLIYHNGEFLPERDAKISLFDSGVQTGDMAFESTRTFNGQPFQLRSHLERLWTSLEILEIDCGHSLEELETLTLTLLDKNRGTETPETEWQIVHNISRGLVAGYLPIFSHQEIRPTVSIHCWPLIPRLASLAEFYDSGVPIVIPEQRALPPNAVDPRAKTRSRVHSQLAQLQANRIAPGSWPLLLDAQGYLAEGPSWNIFLVRDGIIRTPTLRNVLPGVSRSITMQLAQDRGYAVEECDLTIGDGQSADEMFCTATSFSVLPVSSFEGRSVSETCPGPITSELLQAWTDHIGIDFVHQARICKEQLPAWLEREKTAL